MNNKDYIHISQMGQCSMINLSMSDNDFLEFLKKTERDFPSRLFDFSVKEQLRYRFYICNQCYKELKCEGCGCNPYDTFVDLTSCNNGQKFPNLMNRFKWEDFKKKNNLTFVE